MTSNALQQEARMHRVQQCFERTVIVGMLLTLAGCTYHAARQRLPPEEQAIFQVYNKVMTAGQARTYLSKATAAERAAYLEHLGLAQRFQALSPQDRETVLGGFPRQGMSAEALRFLWGAPYYMQGSAKHYARWYYLGSTFALATAGNDYGHHGTMVDVSLVKGRVEWWLEFIPSLTSDGDGGSACLGC
jgi:hypothetical protein